jgi:predicted nicotinamide N-methyase
MGESGGTYGLQRTGQILWDGSTVLSRFIERYPIETVSGKNCVEIGCGVCAVPSHVAAIFGAKTVTATDILEELEELQRNVDRNVEVLAETTKVQVRQLDWSNYDPIDLSSILRGTENMKIQDDSKCRDEVDDFNDHLDVLLCADIVYELSLELLLALFTNLYNIFPNLVCYMANTDRKHVRMFHRRMKSHLKFSEYTEHKQDYPHVVLWKIEGASAR